jgi:hypothetical protein
LLLESVPNLVQIAPLKKKYGQVRRRWPAWQCLF